MKSSTFLTLHVFAWLALSQADRTASAKLSPHLGTCLMRGRGSTLNFSAALKTALLSALIHCFGIGIELALP